eukprot:190764_1
MASSLSPTALPTAVPIFISTESNTSNNTANYTATYTSNDTTNPSKHPSNFPSNYPSKYPTITRGNEQEVKDSDGMSTTYIEEIHTINQNNENNHSVIIGVTIPITLLLFFIGGYIWYRKYKFKIQLNDQNHNQMSASVADKSNAINICDIDNNDATMQVNHSHPDVAWMKANSTSGCDNG